MKNLSISVLRYVLKIDLYVFFYVYISVSLCTNVVIPRLLRVASPRARRRTPRLPLPTARPPFGVGGGFPARHALRRGRSHGLNGLNWRFKASFTPFRLLGGMALHAGRETSVFLILGAFLRKAFGFGHRVVCAEGQRLESPAFGGKSRHLRTAPPHGVRRGTDTPRRSATRPQPPRSHLPCTPFACWAELHPSMPRPSRLPPPPRANPAAAPMGYVLRCFYCNRYDLQTYRTCGISINLVNNKSLARPASPHFGARARPPPTFAPVTT